MTEIKRPNYFTAQFLQENDFNDEQAYHLASRRRNNRASRTSGVGDGLTVTRVSAIQVQVAPGMAIDRDGREILLNAPVTYTLVNRPTGSIRDVYVTISYQDVFDPADLYPVLPDKFTRTTERPLLQDGTAVPATDGSVIVLACIHLSAAGTIDSNASIDLSARTVSRMKSWAGSTLPPFITPQDYGAVGDGQADDTTAIQSAIGALSRTRRVLYFPPGTYRVTSTLQINEGYYHFAGYYGARATGAGGNHVSGSEIRFEGPGPLFQIGTDNGQPWDAFAPDGPQGTRFENLWMSTKSTTWNGTLGSLNGTTHYKTGTYAIRAWRGEDVQLRHVGIESFEYGFWGIQSYRDLFEHITVLYCKTGIYAGPYNNQMTIADAYASFCDVFLYCDKAHGLRLNDAQVTGCGTATAYPITITRASANIVIMSPWLQHYEGYSGGDQCGFIGVGLVDGYKGPSAPPGDGAQAVHGVSIHDPLCLGTVPGDPNHTQVLVDVGAVTSLSLYNPRVPINSGFNIFNALVRAPAGTSFREVDCKVLVFAEDGTLDVTNIFLNAGTGSPDFAAMMTGRSAVEFASQTGRLRTKRTFAGTPAGADVMDIGTEGVAGGVFITTPTLTGAPTTRVKLSRAIWNDDAAPTTGTWQKGDIIFSRQIVPGGKIGWVCTSGGTPGTWKAWGAIDA